MTQEQQWDHARDLRKNHVDDPQQRVWVVMSNDYPDSVFSNEEDAEAYVECMSAGQRKVPSRSRIYWRCYEFKVEGRR